MRDLLAQYEQGIQDLTDRIDELRTQHGAMEPNTHGWAEMSRKIFILEDMRGNMQYAVALMREGTRGNG